MNRVGYIILVIASAVGLYGCSSGKRVVKTGDETVMSSDSPYARMVESYTPWSTISFPVKVRVESPAAMSISGKVYMVRGESIHVSMRMLGFEVGVLHADHDSIYCMDKFHKMAVVGSMESVRTSLGLDLTQLQDILVGRWFAPDSPHGYESGGYSYSFEIDSVANQIDYIAVVTPGDRREGCTYDGWRECVAGMFPTIVSSRLNLKGKDFAVKLVYSPGSVAVNRDDMPRFRRPGDDYTRISPQGLLKGLTTL